jgi:hypothetical protein
MHYGDGGQYHETLRECVGRAVKEIKKIKPDKTEVVVNGDAVAGSDMVRMQSAQNIVQLGHEQVAWCAWEIKGWDKELDADWVFTSGHHDCAKKDDLLQPLVFMLRIMGVRATNARRTYIGNFAPESKADMWYEAEHGFGTSSYYANSYAEIRAVRQQAIQHSRVEGVLIHRFLRAHSHWLNVGQAVGFDTYIDTTGGWHRQERKTLPSSIRMTGVLLYLWDDKLDVKIVECDKDLLAEEADSVALHYKNMKAASGALMEVVDWGGKERLW